MIQDRDRLKAHEARLVDLWEKMVRTVGIHTVSVLLDRAIWDTAEKHPELALIAHDDNGLSFEAFDRTQAAKSSVEMDAAFGDLSSELLLIMTRLLGREMAQTIAKELEGEVGQRKESGETGEAPE